MIHSKSPLSLFLYKKIKLQLTYKQSVQIHSLIHSGDCAKSMSNQCRFYVTVLTLIFSSSFSQCATLDDLDFWPLFTPMLGNISRECQDASEAYINHLTEVLSNPSLASTNPEHRNALRRFDSNGPIPFLQEGQLQDTMTVDLCETFQLEGLGCRLLIPEGLRYFDFPHGHASGPGLERVCRDLDKSKYCHNYLAIFERTPEPETRFSTLKMKSQHFQAGRRKLNRNLSTYPVNLTRALESWTNEQIPVSIDIDITKLPKLSEILMKRHKTFERLGVAMREIVSRLNLSDNLRDVDPKLLLGVWISQWWGLNIINAPWNPSALPYQGVCYPDACSKEDIQTNNVAYAWKIYGDIQGSPAFAFSPLIPWKTTEEDITYGYKYFNIFILK